MSANKKIEEGLEHIKSAEKCLKTSLLKWRPDFDEAADEYNKAATCFRIAKSFEQCRDCLLKASNCHKQNKNGFYAAKALDQAILVCKELSDLGNVASMAKQAANLYQTGGNAESASSSLEKAAKILEQKHLKDALSLFQQAAEISIIQDSTRQAAEYMSKVARIHVKLQEYDLAADAIRREMGLHQQSEAYQAIGRLAVALVLVQLARGDVVAAEKAFKEWGNCCEAPEVQCLESLLTAYDEEDRDQAKRALGNPFIKFMDIEYAILARDMPLPEETRAPVKAPETVNIDKEDTSGHEEQGDQAAAGEAPIHEDDEEEGIC
ncbi:PREDICTED: gamma-soluble NSF attachment protein-like [Nicrophorus vespilloides]|uniref:Gamma-soluble NSF attachment protein n=1 Tax=Nicrophorus vespilloides TaxID=110193 RepID=A0ABM1N027_NICVS|nr:PREDICTED: gamma-soluble NSF attachment protein-like [Nicrophorus vespilloides]